MCRCTPENAPGFCGARGCKPRKVYPCEKKVKKSHLAGGVTATGRVMSLCKKILMEDNIPGNEVCGRCKEMSGWMDMETLKPLDREAMI